MKTMTTKAKIKKLKKLKNQERKENMEGGMGDMIEEIITITNEEEGGEALIGIIKEEIMIEILTIITRDHKTEKQTLIITIIILNLE